MAGHATVEYGWVVRDRASVVHGMAIGPSWLVGKSRFGPLTGGYHNLLTKDIVFEGKGKHALDAIVGVMNGLPTVKIRCGIREGMQMERFEESEYGGGMDEHKVTATRKDVSRVPYGIYVHRITESDYSFKSQLASLVTRMIPPSGSFASAGEGSMISPAMRNLLSEHATMPRDLYDAAVTVSDHVRNMMPAQQDLAAAIGSKKVRVVLSSKLHSRVPIATHSHTHSLPTLARDIGNAVMHLWK